MQAGDKVRVVRGKYANNLGIIESILDNKRYANVRYLHNDKLATLKLDNLELYQEEQVPVVVMSPADKLKHEANQFAKLVGDEIERMETNNLDQVRIPMPNGRDDIVIVNDKKEKEEEKKPIMKEMTPEEEFKAALDRLIDTKDIPLIAKCFNMVVEKNDVLVQIKTLLDVFYSKESA